MMKLEKRHGEPKQLQGLGAVTVKKVICKTNSDWTACAPRDVDSYFLVSINLAHSDVTIDIPTQKSLLQDVKLCANPSL